MSDLAPLLQRFFTDKLDRHLDASPHTKAAYADTFRLLLTYAERATGIAPSALTLADLDADLIGGFLQHLETERGNSVATRNARRAALRSFFSYASYRAPDAIATISQVLAIPAKRTKTTLVSFLTAAEAEALIAAPDTGTWLGRRDRLLLHLGIQTGLRVSELTSLRIDSIQIGQGQRCWGDPGGLLGVGQQEPERVGVGSSGALLRGPFPQQPRFELVQHVPRVSAALITMNHHLGPPDPKPGDPNDRPVRSSEPRPEHSSLC